MIVSLLLCLVTFGDGHTKLDSNPEVEPNSAFKGTWKMASYSADGKEPHDPEIEVWWVVSDEDWYEVWRNGDYLRIIHWNTVSRREIESGRGIALTEVVHQDRFSLMLGWQRSGYYKLEGDTLTVTNSYNPQKPRSPVLKGFEPEPGKSVAVFRRVKRPKQPLIKAPKTRD